MANEWVTLAILGRPRGNRGELTAVALTDQPDRLEKLREVFLFGEGQPFEIESVWQHDGRPVFKFRGIDSISDAEQLQGAEVRVPLSERMPLDRDEFYQSDLVGCEVIERTTGESLGSVTAWEDSGGPGLLVIDGGLLIPFARSICVNIDTAARRILVDLPEGLKELNRS